jgi:hypothetical protein
VVPRLTSLTGTKRRIVRCSQLRTVDVLHSSVSPLTPGIALPICYFRSAAGLPAADPKGVPPSPNGSPAKGLRAPGYPLAGRLFFVRLWALLNIPSESIGSTDERVDEICLAAK